MDYIKWKINPLIYMDNIKLKINPLIYIDYTQFLSEDENESESVIETIWIFAQDIGM